MCLNEERLFVNIKVQIRRARFPMYMYTCICTYKNIISLVVSDCVVLYFRSLLQVMLESLTPEGSGTKLSEMSMKVRTLIIFIYLFIHLVFMAFNKTVECHDV